MEGEATAVGVSGGRMWGGWLQRGGPRGG
jgi:hypothetical protein